MMRKPALFCLTGLLIAAATPSFACPSQGSVFQDSFTDQTGGWEADTHISYGPDGATVVLAPTDSTFPELNGTFLSKDGDYCFDAQFPKTLPGVASIGLLFWAGDYSNYYNFQISTDGHSELYRRVGGNWITVFDAANPTVKKDAGASNEVRVVAKGNLMSLYVNGQKVRDVRGQPPTGNSRFGFYTQLEKAAPDAAARTFVFKDYAVN